MTADGVTADGVTAHGVTAHGVTAHGVTAHGVTGDGMRPAPGTPARAAVLEHRYRLLLLAYPRSYRRTHGTEILTTLMDAAAPDRARPTGREVRDLLAGGLRQRFRLPVGRSMVLVAVVSALVLGALGGATGSASGWATARAAPDDAAFAGIVGTTIGEPPRWAGQRDSQPFGLRSRVLTGRVVPDGWTADAARARLAAEGWRVGPVETHATPVHRDTGETVDSTYHLFVARKGGTEILVSGQEIPGSMPQAMVMAQGVEPWLVLPLTVAGLILGLLGGWLLAARIGYRVRRLSPVRQMPYVVAATIAAAALGVSAPAVLHAVGERVLMEVFSHPLGQDRFFGPSAFAAFRYDEPLDPVMLTGLGALAVLIALTSVPWKSARTATT